jgi:transcriptional regulator with XRE-family HTH domain
VNNFGEYIRKRYEQRNWKQADLARAAKLDTAVISNLVHGHRGPGLDTIVAIARAFDDEPEKFFRAAIGLPPDPEYSEYQRSMMYQMGKLPLDEQRVYVEILEVLMSNRRA